MKISFQLSFSYKMIDSINVDIIASRLCIMIDHSRSSHHIITYVYDNRI